MKSHVLIAFSVVEKILDLCGEQLHEAAAMPKINLNHFSYLFVWLAVPNAKFFFPNT